MKPPTVAAFDMIGTVFSLESLRPRMEAAGLKGEHLELWFAHLLRDAFALSATGIYKPFLDIAGSALAALLEAHRGRADASRIDRVLGGFAELDAFPDAKPAFERLQSAGVRVMTLTNGSASVSKRLLDRAGLSPYVERVISIDEIEKWKPRREVYLHAARVAGVPARQVTMIAGHAWDLQGAAKAGLMTAFVRRVEPFSLAMERPTLSAGSLTELAREITATTAAS